jgi:hypothetical protein
MSDDITPAQRSALHQFHDSYGAGSPCWMVVRNRIGSAITTKLLRRRLLAYGKYGADGSATIVMTPRGYEAIGLPVREPYEAPTSPSISLAVPE